MSQCYCTSLACGRAWVSSQDHKTKPAETALSGVFSDLDGQMLSWPFLFSSLWAGCPLGAQINLTSQYLLQIIIKCHLSKHQNRNRTDPWTKLFHFSALTLLTFLFCHIPLATHPLQEKLQIVKGDFWREQTLSGTGHRCCLHVEKWGSERSICVSQRRVWRCSIGWASESLVKVSLRCR